MSELQEQPDQPGAPPGLTGKVVEIGVHQAVSLQDSGRDASGNVQRGEWTLGDFQRLGFKRTLPRFPLTPDDLSANLIWTLIAYGTVMCLRSLDDIRTKLDGDWLFSDADEMRRCVA